MFVAQVQQHRPGGQHVDRAVIDRLKALGISLNERATDVTTAPGKEIGRVVEQIGRDVGEDHAPGAAHPVKRGEGDQPFSSADIEQDVAVFDCRPVKNPVPYTRQPVQASTTRRGIAAKSSF